MDTRKRKTPEKSGSKAAKNEDEPASKRAKLDDSKKEHTGCSHLPFNQSAANSSSGLA